MPATLRGALRRARVEAVRHMRAADASGFDWKEETVTDIVVAAAHPLARSVMFNRREESRIGADWLWWWVDASGEAFGMLIQAKRLRLSGHRWKFDFAYKQGTQRRTLLEVSDALQVAPAYALYLGTPAFRGNASCGSYAHGGNCLECRARSTSMMPAILADSALIDDASSTYGRSVPLERISDPAARPVPWRPGVTKALSSDLAAFLGSPKIGARSVARTLIDLVGNIRVGQFAPAATAVTGVILSEALEPVFADVPGDRGHWDRPYFREILRGLRRVPPDYVLAARYEPGALPQMLAATLGDTVSSLAGIVVVRVDGEQADR